MINDLFVDCTYIGINRSPRSDVLPKFYSIEALELNIFVNIRTTIPNFFKIIRLLTELEVSTNKVFIEYDGNFLLNFLINLKFFRKVKYIDCHNCAVENEDGKFLRYCINLAYLLFSKLIFRAKLVVHNQSIMESYPLSSIVVNTPYPDLSQYRSDLKNNDVLFSCSLNSDEPIELIIQTCRNLKKLGYKTLITGDFKKISKKLQDMGAPFFSGYITKASYFELLSYSKVMVCLTNRKKTLLYSPREGISLGLTVIMSDNQVNRDFYGDKGIYFGLQDNLADIVINAIK